MRRDRNYKGLRKLSPNNALRTKWIRYVRIIRHFIAFLKSYDYRHIYEIEHYACMKRFTNIGGMKPYKQKRWKIKNIFLKRLDN